MPKFKTHVEEDRQETGGGGGGWSLSRFTHTNLNKTILFDVYRQSKVLIMSRLVGLVVLNVKWVFYMRFSH